MPSILPGYEYDIFISYRHNDNQYDGWVSEFVEKLRKELVATVKDKLTVFFDENPEDGLLESHHVDHTISSKIKALIFIPIVSQTYCDTKSFAWNNEFLLFSKAASEDRCGREIKLPNGNIASRILPVRIHEIDNEDVGLLETVLQGALRSIDFIYHAQGVNRPLRPKDDDRQDNVNNTIYRNQINKVANAIKEIIIGMKSLESKSQNITKPSAHSHEETMKVPAMPRWYNTTVPSDIRHVLKEDREEVRERAVALLRKVGLSAKADVYPGELSGGQQQRVAIARSLAMRPEVMLFDEVTAALDPETVKEVLNTIRELALEGMTCMIVTHEMRFARELAHVVYFTDGGVIVESGPPADLFDRPVKERTRAFLSQIL